MASRNAGAVATGAAHGSIGSRPGIATSTRRTRRPAVVGRTTRQRVFVLDLMDWFTGFTIAGWGAAGINLNCSFECCDRQSLTRFFDDRLSADDHNRTVLSFVAEHVLDTGSREPAR